MQFYKKRDFSSLINDTFSFIRIYGKNYFKNYITINGVLLLLILVLYLVGFRGIFSQIFSNNISGQSYYLEQYFQENYPSLIIFGILFLLIMLATTLVIYSYPVLYMKRLAEGQLSEIKLQDIILDLKKNRMKFFKFLMGMFFILMPIMLILLMISSFLIIIIIGFFLIILLIPTIINVVNFTLFDYFHTEKGFFASLSYGMRSQFSYLFGNHRSPFWKYWGSTAIVAFILQTISSVFSLIPAFMMMGTILTVPDAGKEEAMQNFFQGTTGFLYFFFNAIAVVISLILTNIIFINAGLMYYDSRIDLHINDDLTEIESIGNSEF